MKRNYEICCKSKTRETSQVNYFLVRHIYDDEKVRFKKEIQQTQRKEIPISTRFELLHYEQLSETNNHLKCQPSTDLHRDNNSFCIESLIWVFTHCILKRILRFQFKVVNNCYRFKQIDCENTPRQTITASIPILYSNLNRKFTWKKYATLKLNLSL